MKAYFEFIIEDYSKTQLKTIRRLSNKNGYKTKLKNNNILIVYK